MLISNGHLCLGFHIMKYIDLTLVPYAIADTIFAYSMYICITSITGKPIETTG